MKEPPKKKQICLIAPFDLVEWLEAQAENEHRSMSNQIVYLLSQAKDANETQGY